MTRRIAATALVAVGIVFAACGEAEQPGASASLTAAGVERAAPVAAAPATELVAGLNDAGFDLWRTRPVAGNLVFSPASIGHALLMGRAAADDATGRAIDEAFGLPPGLAAHEAWNQVDQAIAGSADAMDGVTVRVVDRIWPRVDADPDEAWVNLLTTQHGVTTELLDFVDDPAGSRKAINDWVEDQTEGLISDLLSEDAINDRTVLILTDAIYFGARWSRFFGDSQNRRKRFTLLDGSVTKVEYMRHQKLRDYFVGDGFVSIEIPYQGDDFSMLLIVPDEGVFEELRAEFDQELIAEVDDGMVDGPVKLFMPGWSTSTKLDLAKWLTELGAAPGNYPAIHPSAFLAAAVHGADITVDKKGTVAAAATALSYELSAPPEPEQVIWADRPFFFLIRHRPTGLVLFAGQVTDPTA